MKRLVTIVGSAIALFAPLLSSAQSFINRPQPGNFAASYDLADNIVRILNWVLGASGIVVVGVIIVGGFFYITSAGNEDMAEQGKEMVTGGVIGLVVVLLAFTIANTVNVLLGG